jgi:hypothetical protein
MGSGTGEQPAVTEQQQQHKHKPIVQRITAALPVTAIQE